MSREQYKQLEFSLMQPCDNHEVNNNHDKIAGQFRLALNGVFAPLMFYGLQDKVGDAVEQVVTLTNIYHRRMNGEDISYPHFNDSYANDRDTDHGS